MKIDVIVEAFCGSEWYSSEGTPNANSQCGTVGCFNKSCVILSSSVNSADAVIRSILGKALQMSADPEYK